MVEPYRWDKEAANQCGSLSDFGLLWRFWDSHSGVHAVLFPIIEERPGTWIDGLQKLVTMG